MYSACGEQNSSSAPAHHKTQRTKLLCKSNCMICTLFNSQITEALKIQKWKTSGSHPEAYRRQWHKSPSNAALQLLIKATKLPWFFFNRIPPHYITTSPKNTNQGGRKEIKKKESSSTALKKQFSRQKPHNDITKHQELFHIPENKPSVLFKGCWQLCQKFPGQVLHWELTLYSNIAALF